ncbi:MAG TPA: Hsp20/alpha crystallin family protein [Bacteroidetes bacterium]|nr:Hsp20/alpha crystallin family protein [Bacteroidota bacterium]
MQVIRKRKPVNTFPTVFNHFINDAFFNANNAKTSLWNGSTPAINVRENDDQFELEVAAPGFDKKDFKLEVLDNVLTISAEVKKEHEEKDGEKWTRREFSYNSFSRSFTLPDTVDGNKIAANYKNGILAILIPKKEEAKPQPVRTIKIG